jgi:ferredoxin
VGKLIEQSSIQIGSLLFRASKGANLRRALIKEKQQVYHPDAIPFHCRGMGTCGTCAVKLVGPQNEMSLTEKWRLSLFPFKQNNGLRLACQAKILGNVTVEKLSGFWGQGEEPKP